MAKVNRRLRGVSECINAMLEAKNANHPIYVATDFEYLDDLDEVIMKVLVTKGNDTIGYITLRFRSQDSAYIAHAVGSFFGSEDSSIKIAVLFNDDTLETMTIKL